MGQHPRLRWNRRRRSIEMKFNRSRYLLQNYRELQRRLAELLASNNLIQKRSIKFHPNVDLNKSPIQDNPNIVSQLELNPYRAKRDQKKRINRSTAINLHKINNKKSLIGLPRTVNTIMHRQQRQPFQGDEAYSKYMYRIKQKYQNYVKSILGYHDNRNITSNKYNSKSNAYAATTLPTNYETNKPLLVNVNSIPVSLPIISDTSRYLASVKKKQTPNQCSFSNNTYCIQSSDPRNKYLNVKNVDDQKHSQKPNITELIAKLKSQFVRRKRSAKQDDGTRRNKRRNNRKFNLFYSSFQADEDEKDSDGSKRGKPKGPCEVCVS